MAASLFDQVKSLASSEVVNRIAGGIGENPQATERALTGAAMPAVLGGLAQQFSSGSGPTRLLDVIKQHDPDGKLLDNLNTATNQNVGAIQTQGQGLIGSLFGPRADGVADVVAGHAGIRKSSATSLMSIAATMILGFLGQKVMRGGLDAGGLGSLLSGVRGDLGRIAPPGLASAMGVPSFTPEPAYAAAASATARDTTYRDTTIRRDTEEGTGLRRWLPWAVAALVLLGAIALFRTCRMAQPTAPPVPHVTTPAVPRVTTPAAPTVTAPAIAPSAPVNLPSGVHLNLPTNSLAYGLANYLGDSTAAAPPRRFTFENMRFPTSGATLSEASQSTLNDVSEILKAYPNAAVRVEGFTDNTGNPQANMGLSQARAEAVRNDLINRGIPADRIQAQGFGQNNPVASNDDEAGRAQNRRTDLVVTSR